MIVKIKIEGSFCMKKQWAYFIITLILLVQASSCSFANNSDAGMIRIAIKKYKAGNYTGCLQSCQYIIKSNPSNALAYYYIAMSYVQAGKKNEAINAYAKVLSLKPNAKLAEYATTGIRCLETPDQCVLQTDTGSSISPELDKFIAAPYSDGLSDTVRRDSEQKRLDEIKNQINSDKELDDYQFRKLNDASGQVSPDVNKTTANKPTNDEVVAALKTLNDAGLNPYGGTTNPYEQMVNYQNPEMAQLNMLGATNNQTGNNDAMLNMLPFMLSQNKNGTSSYSPQLMQAVIMNSMIPDFNVNLNKDNDTY